MTTMTHTHLDLTGDPAGPVHVLDWGGDGPWPTVLVHGLDGSAANWFDVGPSLAAEGRVVAPDLPGFGRTPLAGRRPTMASCADVVAATIRTLGLDTPVSLMGNSMGAPVALWTAVRHPGLVRDLTMVAPAVPRTADRAVEWGFLATFVLPFAVPGLMKVEPARRHAKEPTRAVRDLLDLCYTPGSRESDAAFAEMVDVAARRDRDDHVDGWYLAARSLFAQLARPRRFHAMAARVSCPVHVVAGARDPIIPTSSIDAAAARHPDWRITFLPGTGHVPQLESPDAFLAAVAEQRRS